MATIPLNNAIRIQNTLDNGRIPPSEDPRGLAIQRARQLRYWGMTYAREQDLPPIAGDCSSFISECYRFAGFQTPDSGRMNSSMIAGTSLVDRMKLIGFEEVEIPVPGDVVVFKWGAFPQHLGLVSFVHDVLDYDIIHLSHKAGKVIECPLSGEWLSRFHCYLTLKQWQKPPPQKKESSFLPRLDVMSDGDLKESTLPRLG